MIRDFMRGSGVVALLALTSGAALTADSPTATPTPPARRATPAPAPITGTALISPVTDAMLAKPPAQDWLMWRGTLNSWGYSPLTQITARNVSQLQLVWTRSLEAGSQEGTPLVHDGVLYFPNPGDVTQAVNAANGDIIWEHRRPYPEDIEKFINAPFINRNLGIHGNLLIDTSADGAVYALDARNGKEVWSTQVLDYQRGVHQTSGPIIADGKVFSGRGCEPIVGANPEDCVITAHDAATGKELWRTRTIPGPGEPGNDSWGDVPYSERKHVGTWMPPSYDPELKLLYIGTSVTSPGPKYMLGGNEKQHLYHNCTLAIDPATGRIVWYYQHLIDNWDFDHTFERLLIDTVVTPSKTDVAWINPDIKAGQVYKVLTGIPGKTGVVYTLDRRTGQFLWARPTIRQDAVESIDGRTGAVKTPAKSLFHAKGDKADVCPSATGGKNWPAGAYSPLTKIMYYPLQNTCSHFEVNIGSRAERSAYGFRSTQSIAPGTTNVGAIYAVSAVTGRVEWKFEQRAATLSLVTTGGGLLFGGDVAGRFRAYDQKSGAILWEVNLGSQVTGFPVSYAVNGRQYIAVSTGQAVNTGGYLNLTPEIRVGRSNNLYVFALPAGFQIARASSGASGAGVAIRPVNSGAVAAVPAISAISACRKTDASTAAAAGATLATPVARFSRVQVDAGKKLYAEQQCATCHGASMTGTNAAPALADEGFRNAWRTRTLPELLDCTRTTMPPGRAGTLTDTQYQNLVGAILDANGLNQTPR
jgi:PQQ-dependent dehydrogenase (methanol/ethanol family)